MLGRRKIVCIGCGTSDGMHHLGCKGDIKTLQNLIAELTPVPVVAGVIKNKKGKYLITKRKPTQWMGNKWCFAGGKVKTEETLEDALAREMFEELGIYVLVTDLIHTQIVSFPHGTFLLHYFNCSMIDTVQPQALDCSEFAWVPTNQLTTYDLLPVDIDLALRFILEEKAAELTRLQGLLQDIEQLEKQYEHDNRAFLYGIQTAIQIASRWKG